MAWRKPRCVRCDVYSIDIFLFDSPKRAVKWHNAMINRDWEPLESEFKSVRGFCTLFKKIDLSKRGWTWAIAIAVARDDNMASVLVHETAHASHMILDHVGVEVAYENTEAMAYLQDSIFSQCASELEIEL